MRKMVAFCIFAALVSLTAAGCIGSENAVQYPVTLSSITGNAVMGEVSHIDIESPIEGAVVTLPPGMFAVSGKTLCTENTFALEGGRLSLDVLVPPMMDEFEITIANEDHSEIIRMVSSEGSSPLVSGQKIFDRVDEITSTYVVRITETPMHQLFKLYLKLAMEEYGLDVHMTPVESGDGRTLTNVVGYKWGANEKEWIVIGGHADTAFEITVEGAYDNTAGVATVLELARVLSQYEFDKTIVFAAWGGEEEGLWGSKFFVDNIPDDVTVTTYLNFDMVGINWPGPDKLHEFTRSGSGTMDKELARFGEFVTFDVCGYPEEGFAIKKDTLGRSDHVNFGDAGIPSFMFIGATDEYPYYHTPDDTFANMIEYMGGEEILMKGFAVPAWIGFYVTVLFEGGHFPIAAAAEED
ncbi:MAG: hypothetical protein CVT48_05275 [Thermoplasmata archaeon HGW-Thermoplasmata-1]|nr:MAG: hypothetical protein CVT48_05275 [Thermoplasmata archaeon HGW-Thermoplasmata-1]